MNEGIRALNILISHIETEAGSDDYYEVKNAKVAIEEELRVLEILHKHIKWQGSLQYILFLSKLLEKERKSVTQKMLDNRDIPFTVAEFGTIARWLRRKEELK